MSIRFGIKRKSEGLKRKAQPDKDNRDNERYGGSKQNYNRRKTLKCLNNFFFLLFTLSCQNFEVKSGELGNEREREKGVESMRERERERKGDKRLNSP